MRIPYTKVVAVSGGFDPIHPGHIEYLKEAAKLGYPGRVVVILNSDRFLKKKKGFVFMKYEDRKKILEAIKYVDRVVKCVDKDQSVCKTLEWLKPDVFAKGGDRTLENTPERDICIKKNIRMVFGVGGGKTNSSSWILNKFIEHVGDKDKKDNIRRGRGSDRSRQDSDSKIQETI